MDRYDLTGQKFGRWTAIKWAGKRNNINLWLCQCECGTRKIVQISNLTKGYSKSCGCLSREQRIGNKTRLTHGMSRTRLYYIWQGMKARATGNESRGKYKELNVSLAPEWNQFENFMEWSLKNGYKDDLSLDRIDTYGNYEPSNCRWTTIKVQNRNKTTTIFLTLNGETKSMGEWSELLKIPMSTMVNRRKKGLPVELILHKGRFSTRPNYDEIARMNALWNQ